MSAIRRNIIANLLGGVWTTVLTLAITPLQVNLLGIEAYGLIGFIATLQIAFAIFDLGLSSTLTRELAADHSEGHVQSAELLRTASTIYWAFALIVGTCLAASANFIANHWFNITKGLSIQQVEQALYVIILFLAVRWPVALYGGVLSGLQRLDVLNVVKVVTTSLRLLGGIVVLLVWRDLQVFLWWTAINAIVEVIAYQITCQRVHRTISWRPGISLTALRKVWSFSLSMTAISLLALLLSQLDRLMLSKLVSLDDLGYYMLAYNAAASISLSISAISSAMLPSFAAVSGHSGAHVLLRRYDRGNRVILFIVGLATCILVFFGDTILSLWVGTSAATKAYPPLTLLAIGFWCSALLSNAYSLAVATGNPSLPLRLSALSAVPYLVALYVLVKSYGIYGAGLAWLLLNLSYVAVLIPVVHRKLLMLPTRGWFLGTVAPFVLMGCASFALPRMISDHLPVSSRTVSNIAALGTAIALYGLFGYRLLGAHIQAEIVALLRYRGKRASSLFP